MLKVPVTSTFVHVHVSRPPVSAKSPVAYEQSCPSPFVPHVPILNATALMSGSVADVASMLSVTVLHTLVFTSHVAVNVYEEPNPSFAFDTESVVIVSPSAGRAAADASNPAKTNILNINRLRMSLFSSDDPVHLSS